MSMERVHQNACAVMEAAQKYEYMLRRIDSVRAQLAMAESAKEQRALTSALRLHEQSAEELHAYMVSLLGDIEMVVSRG